MTFISTLDRRQTVNMNRLNAQRPVLDDAALATFAPAVFADAKHHTRSDRFAHIPTFEMVNRLRAEGFQPVFAQERRTRSDRRGFTKHLIRFRHDSTQGIQLRNVGDTVPEVVLINGHDGTATYQLYAGVFRLICLNGMVAGENIKSVKVPHKGNVIGKVIEGSYEVLNEATSALQAADNWGEISLNRDERQVFAEAAHALRFSDGNGNVTTPVSPRQLLEPRRQEDAGNDLWRTFQVIHENSTKGGVSAYDAALERYRTTRPVEGIDQNTSLNRALWVLTERMAEIKAAA